MTVPKIYQSPQFSRLMLPFESVLGNKEMRNNNLLWLTKEELVRYLILIAWESEIRANLIMLILRVLQCTKYKVHVEENVG